MRKDKKKESDIIYRNLPEWESEDGGEEQSWGLKKRL